MKLESLKLDKFKDYTLTKKEQLFILGGDGIETGPGHIKDPMGSPSGTCIEYDYGYDANRGGFVLTFHNRTNVVPC